MPSSSLFLRSSATLVIVLSLLTAPINAYSSDTYALDTTYAGDSFFDGFDFFTDADPTHGFVTYVDESTAKSSGLISSGYHDSVIIGVDSTHTYNSSQPYWGINGVGRPSVRLTSTKKYNHGLFIADISHMPGGVCGTWPALWTLGDGTWPYHGEVDILEGANDQTTVLSSLHTAGQCSIAGDSRTETGIFQTSDCQYDVSTGANAVGCGISSTDTNSYGTGFNANHGGVYAMQWTSDYIKIWFFPRGSVPRDIEAGKPTPDAWGLPTSNFQGDCDIDANFLNHQIVLDATFCGDLAGGTWNNACAAKTGYSSCAAYVGDNPKDFADMFWDIKSIKVYQLTSGTNGTSTPTTTPTATSSDGCPVWTGGCTPPAYLTNLPSSIQAELPAWTGSPPASWCSYTSWMQAYTSANSVYASCSAKAASNSSYYTCTAPSRNSATPTDLGTITTGTGTWTTPTSTGGSTWSNWGNDPTGVTYIGTATSDFALTTGWAQSSLAAAPMGGDGSNRGAITMGGVVYSWGSSTTNDPATKTKTTLSTTNWASWSDPSTTASTTTNWASWSDPSTTVSTTTNWASWSDPSTTSSTTTTWGVWTTASSTTVATSTPTSTFTYSRTSWTYNPASSSAYWAMAGGASSTNTLTTSSVAYAAAATSTGSSVSWDPTSTGPQFATFTGTASSTGVSVIGGLAIMLFGLFVVAL